MSDKKIIRAALFSRSDSESMDMDKLYRMQQYCVANGYTITRSFYSEQEILDCREDFDVILSCGETVMLPLVGIELIDIARVG